MKKTLIISLFIIISAILTACGGDKSSSGETDGLLSDGKLVVGVTAGPHEQILEKVKELGEEEGLDIELKVFNDYVMPNVALSEGEIDINSFQTEPFFDQMNEERGLDLIKVADTVTFPMGIYSEKIDDIKDLSDGAKIGLPSDPTNSGRALALFEKAGLIKMKEDAGTDATIKDIEENNNNYEFIELDSAQIARQLGELDAAAINTNFAMEHGFVPNEDSIFIEGQDSPYANLIAVRNESKDEEVVQQFIDLYQSDEVKAFVEEEFQGSVIASW
ncbi:metal ABC transporter substrate-binding protein [Oceanobacillus zhaokaii]|uniref:Lipoprotein n=1 Tax=Oceanobacillus zhaokaii TaxID=2052660 RepID=A0A345PK23_9BACI|nr:MetQ/NlpA family ABC transporter substrate-binding protein [Oceanobacillus zhaokaii]AXI10353.1 metal ABC transporter substrate-binding protein [Oceanobacillus zhaokaii]